MKYKNYHKAVKVFQSAINLAPEQKSEFLTKECGEDLELRREVEMLLKANDQKSLKEKTMNQKKSSHKEAATLLSDPARRRQGDGGTSGSGGKTNDATIKMDFSAGENNRFGQYRIACKLGEGGMGQVFLAFDKNLDRKVALKILPPELTHHKEYLQRFKQEARAASALNHPYILTIFEFGQNADGVHYIVSEYVEGRTLNKFCREEGITLSDKLDILIRIASALSAAHEAGIIHRDIKPDNIIVRPDGYIKILDFGLAKLLEGYRNFEAHDAHDETRSMVRTNPGMVMGTAGYMSPEQAKGKDIDERTDIFSFGVLFYEMISGHLPFKGDSAMEMIAAILHHEPLPLDDVNIPLEIKRIIEKALRKDRDERYPAMKDLLKELKETRRNLDFQNKLEEDSSNETDSADTDIYKSRTTNRNPAGKSEKLDQFTEISTADEKPGGVSYAPYAFLIFGLLSVGTLIWFFGFRNSLSNNNGNAFVPGSLKSVEITNWANSAGELSTSGTFSGDGKFIAFGSTKNGPTSIWVKQTSGGDPLQITKDEFYNRHPVWSPNGEEIVYYSKRGDKRGLWRVSLMGGQQKLVADNVESESKPRFWSKDGKIYFQGSSNLFTADAETGDVKQITDFPAKDYIVKVIKVSPDESQIAYLTIEKAVWKINVKPLEGGSVAQVIDSEKPIEDFVWHPDGKSILYSWKTEDFYQIFKTGLRSGEPVQLTFNDGDCMIHDISRDGARILYSSVNENSDLWKVDVDSAEEFLTVSQIDAELWADVSPDNSAIVYQSIKKLRQGSNLLSGSIVSQPLGSESARPLVLSENGFLPQWSPDGKTIAFLKLNGQKLEIWQTADTGDKVKQISETDIMGLEYSLSPYLRSQMRHISWSPDGSTIAFPAVKGGISNIRLVAPDGTNEREITNNRDKTLYLLSPVWSKNGNGIAFISKSVKRNKDGKLNYSLWFYDSGTKEQRKLLETDEMLRLLGWSENGEELIYAAKTEEKEFTMTPKQVPVRAVSLETGTEREVTILKDVYFYNIHLSPDGRSLAYTSRSSGNDDIWIAKLNTDAEQQKLTKNNDPRLYFSSLTWSPDGKAIFLGKQTRFTLLSMLVTPQFTEKIHENSNE